MYLSVIIPTYNEEKRIVKTIEEVYDYLKKQPYDSEIVVVNDGSNDKTVKAASILKTKIANLTIIDNQKNHGKGYVVRQGLLRSKGKYRLFTDADNSTPINQLEKFLPYVKDYDIIIGSRSIKGSKIINLQPFYRRVLGKIYGFLVKIIIGLWSISDTQCGFKMFNAKSISSILSKCIINSFSFDVEILVAAKKLSYKIKEVPVIWLNDQNTKVSFKKMVQSVFDLVRIRWNLVLGRYKTLNFFNF